MPHAPADKDDLKATLLRRFRTHTALAEFVRPLSPKFANLILARTVLLSEFVAELIKDFDERGELDQLRRAIHPVA